MTEVRVAKSAGFCFGVKRAVNKCYEQAEKKEDGPVYTFGPIIHNEQVVDELRERGVQVIEDEDQLINITKGCVIIRSHGVPESIQKKIEAQGLKVVDATCPFVKKIHQIVKKNSEEGRDIVVIGSRDHPEVTGICGWASSPVHVIETEEDAWAFVHEKENDRLISSKSLCIVSQTTFNLNKFDKLVEILRHLQYNSADVLNTICNATEERQTEARQLAADSDVMIVIGGRHSSNTQKLYEICKRECARTYYIEKLADLDLRLMPSRGCLGITAGASTPNYLIEEVSKRCQK